MCFPRFVKPSSASSKTRPATAGVTRLLTANTQAKRAPHERSPERMCGARQFPGCGKAHPPTASMPQGKSSALDGSPPGLPACYAQSGCPCSALFGYGICTLACAAGLWQKRWVQPGWAIDAWRWLPATKESVALLDDRHGGHAAQYPAKALHLGCAAMHARRDAYSKGRAKKRPPLREDALTP